jgi:hypothetical protein
MTALATSFGGLLPLVLAHLFTPAMRFLGGIPRSRWLSLAGGVSVAYVFLHLLPELAEGRDELAGVADAIRLEHATFLVAMIGLVVFYGLERLVRRHRRGRADHERSAPGVFWLHLGSFSLYNLLIGYLLGDVAAGGPAALLLFSLAMLLHFVVTDFGLHADHPGDYRRVGRWVLAASVASGWLLGAALEIPESATIGLTAFLAGGVILNVLKEELPDERQSRFGAFAAGVGVYAALLMAI